MKVFFQLHLAQSLTYTIDDLHSDLTTVAFRLVVKTCEKSSFG